MKKQTLFVSVILIMAILAMALPSAAHAYAEPVGERISLFSGLTEFPASSPFHIRHGWVQNPTDRAIGIFDFALEVDGVRQAESRMFYTNSEDPVSLYRFWVYNFPDGMTGTHTFTGYWYAPCQYAVNELGYPGPCANPMEKVETNSRTIVITFE